MADIREVGQAGGVEQSARRISRGVVSRVVANGPVGQGTEGALRACRARGHGERAGVVRQGLRGELGQSREKGEGREEGVVRAGAEQVPGNGDPNPLVSGEGVRQVEAEEPAAVAVAPVGIRGICPTEAAGDSLGVVGDIGADDEGAEVPVAVADVGEGRGSGRRQDGQGRPEKLTIHILSFLPNGSGISSPVGDEG